MSHDISVCEASQMSDWTDKTDVVASSAMVFNLTPRAQQAHADALPDAFVLVDANGRLLMVNDQAEALVRVIRQGCVSPRVQVGPARWESCTPSFSTN